MRNIADVSVILTRWNREIFGHVQNKLQDCQKRFDILRLGPLTDDSRDEEEQILRELELLFEKEEVYWKQHAKDEWLLEGDRNSSFFSQEGFV